MLSGRQISAARALLGWSAVALAEKVGLARETINKIEAETVQPREGTLADIVRVFDENGVEFTERGVQWTEHQVRTYAGVAGLKTFFDDVRHVIQNSNEEIVICGFSEKYFEDKLGDFIDFQRKEMASHKNIKMRCLVEEGDFSLGASDYCQYRWQPKENFSSVPFYVYGDKTAIIAASAPEDPLTLIINNRTIAQAYRRQFEAMWSLARETPKTKEHKTKKA